MPVLAAPFDSPVDDILNAMTLWFIKGIVKGALESLQTCLTWWMSDTAYSVNFGGKSEGGVLNSLREHTNFLTAIGAFAGFLVAAFRVAVQRRGEPFRAALSQFVELVIIVFTLATAVNLGSIASDRYSTWILQDLAPQNGDWTANWTNSLNWFNGTGTMFLLGFFALAALISSLIQFVLMLFRSGALIILVGTLPAVAASRFSSYGERAYRKSIGWLISWLVYKPVAATIYAAALSLMQSKSQADRLFGLALVGGAIFALPATLRAVMPSVAEDNSFFGVRQVGHFVFGGSSLNAVRGDNVWTASRQGRRRLTGLLFGAPGGNAAAGNGGGGGGGGAPGAGVPGGGVPRGGAPAPGVPGAPGAGGPGPGAPGAGGAAGPGGAPGAGAPGPGGPGGAPGAGGAPGVGGGPGAGGPPGAPGAGAPGSPGATGSSTSGVPGTSAGGPGPSPGILNPGYAGPSGAPVWGGPRDTADGVRGPADGWGAQDFQAAVESFDANQRVISPRNGPRPSGNDGTGRNSGDGGGGNAGPTGNSGT